MASTTMKRRQLIKNDGNSTIIINNSTHNVIKNLTQSAILLVGYDENTGEPIYIKDPCVSNDNDDPYGWNCTDSPTSAPTLYPTAAGVVSGGADGSAGSSGGDSGSTTGSGSSAGGGDSLEHGAVGSGSSSGSGSSAGGGSLEHGSSNPNNDASGSSGSGSSGSGMDDGSGTVGDSNGSIGGESGGSSGGGGGGVGGATDGNNASSSSTVEETLPASYTYQCTSDQYCNTYHPGNSLGLGWTLVGTCQTDAINFDCPEAFDESKAEAKEYIEGDIVLISSDYLNDQVIGSISCPGSASSSGAASSSGVDNDNGIVVPYVYEVETSQVSNANVFLPRLEERILLNLADSMMSCIGGDNASRKLVEKTMLRRKMRVLNDEGEEFAVRGILSNPDDVAVTEGPCTISAPEADNCFIIDGKLTLLLQEKEDPSVSSTAAEEAAATDAAQSNLEEAMTNDDLLSTNTLPEVIKVRYLGDSYEEFLGGFVEDESSSAVTGPLPVGADGENDGTDGGGGDAILAGILGGVFGAILVAMCALLLIKKRTRRASKQAVGDHSQAVVGGDFDWDESFDVNDPKNVHGALVAGRLSNDNNGEMILHVSNLSPNTKEENVRALFEHHGIVNNCIIPADHKGTGVGSDDDNAVRGERFALVAMPTTNETEMAEAESACNHVNGLKEEGHVLVVKEVSTLYVGNLSPNTSEEDVSDLFGQYGTVTGCTIPSDHEGGNTLGGGRFALVTMPTQEASDAISHIHGSKVDGNTLSVRDMKHMNGGRGIPGGGLAAAALAAGVMGAMAAFNNRGFNPQGNDEVTLHVGNLSPNISADDVRRLFEQHGTVSECIIPSNTSGGQRFALVTMPAREAEKACNYVNGIEVDGHQLSVREAQQIGRGGITGRNLLDDTSSAYDNSYYGNYSRRGGSGKNNGGEKEGESPGLLTTLGIISGFLAAPFLKPCKKRSKKESSSSLAHLESITGRSYGQSPDTEQSLDDGLDSIINNIDGATDAHDRRNFVVDPPGAFHLGNHHYTGDGVRYFSPLCEQCIAARVDADGVIALNAINEEDDDPVDDIGGVVGGMDLTDMDDLSFDMEAATKFTDFNSNDLGKAHSSMHVRHCRSTTCNICSKEKGVFFVKARKEPGAGEVL